MQGTKKYIKIYNEAQLELEDALDNSNIWTQEGRKKRRTIYILELSLIKMKEVTKIERNKRPKDAQLNKGEWNLYEDHIDNWVDSPRQFRCEQ